MTTRDAIAGLVSAVTLAIPRLQEFAEILDDMAETPNADVVRALTIARAALASWNARKPLRDEEDVRQVLWTLIQEMPQQTSVTQRAAMVVEAADAIDHTLTPVPGTQETR